MLQVENGAELRRFPLAKQSDDTLYDIWGGEFAIAEAGLYFYYFHITTQDGAFRLFKQGASDTNMEDGGLWQLSVLEEKYPVPDAYAGAVMYQIFPDRFAKSGACDLTDKIQPYWIHENTDDTPVYLPDANGEVLNNDFYGGNLNGIREKLPYLQALGVEILYLNPIFYAWSTHRYDTCDYKRIDPMLGTEEDFRALCEDAHARGMKVDPRRRVQPRRQPQRVFPVGHPRPGLAVPRLVQIQALSGRLRELVGHHHAALRRQDEPGLSCAM